MSRLFTVVLLLGSVVDCRGQAFVEHLEPPALERGKTTRLILVGSHLEGATDLWSSLPDGKIKATPAGESKAGIAVFDVRVAEDAPVGLFGLRLATVNGLSNLHLCLIDDLPVQRGKTQVRVDLPCALWGRFREAESDQYSFMVKAGQRVSFEVVGNRLGKDVDPILIVRDARGRIVAERDNDAGLYFDCRFAHQFAEAGTYTAEVRDLRYQGHEHGFYVLRMGRFPAARVALPAAVPPGKRVEVGLPELKETIAIEAPASPVAGLASVALRRADDEGSAWLPIQISETPVTVASADALTPEKGTVAKVPGQLCGVLALPGQRQYFRLELSKGQAIQVVGHARWHNSPVDLDLKLTDSQGRTLRPATEGPDDTVQLDITAPAAGVYCLAVRDLARDGGPAFAYRLEVRSGQPRVEIVAEVEGLTIPREGYQIVPLTVTRGGYNGPISLNLSGSPPEITLSPAEIPAGVNAVVARLTAGPTAPLGLHSLQIIAQPADNPAAVKTLVRTRPLVDRQLLNPDLIPYSLREDQRRLPPSVHDRLALQVTPLSPFAVELAEPTVTLARYQHADIPLAITRKMGFDAPITFTARGGQLADRNEGRTRVYAEFPEATRTATKVSGRIHSRILSNLGKTRIEVLASAIHEGRKIRLIRSFELEIRTAFTLPASTMPVKLKPGETTRVRLAVERMKTFQGPVRVKLSQAAGLQLPEAVVIPAGQAEVEIEVKAETIATPGRRGIGLSATADVDGFEEEFNGGRIEIEVLNSAEPKK
jgi:hypothetical protein